MGLDGFCKLVEILWLYDCINEVQGLVSHCQSKSHVTLQKKFILLELPKSGFGSELAMGQGKWGGWSVMCPPCFIFT